MNEQQFTHAYSKDDMDLMVRQVALHEAVEVFKSMATIEGESYDLDGCEMGVLYLADKFRLWLEGKK